jgi:hypothetical protein
MAVMPRQNYNGIGWLCPDRVIIGFGGYALTKIEKPPIGWHLLGPAIN